MIRRKCYGVVYLIDYENVHCNGLVGVEELTRTDTVIVFCRADDVKRVEIFLFDKKIKCKVYCNIVSARTKNALDFEIVTYIGLHRKKYSIFYVVSDDHGYDAAIEQFMREKVICFRRKSVINTKNETLFIYYGQTSNGKVLQIK